LKTDVYVICESSVPVYLVIQYSENSSSTLTLLVEVVDQNNFWCLDQTNAALSAFLRGGVERQSQDCSTHALQTNLHQSSGPMELSNIIRYYQYFQ
jgi:hypothetical protein